ncbi:sialoadhesin [Synchiropus splendidus]|uniref:sialoadhesin n=1 Tax=Synchiropus splendidus TaxID=270530 RepID=UPI00237DEB0B|nr:sialoadhesin [Synchiropus splendidus]
MHVDTVVCVFHLIFANLWRRVLTQPPEPSIPDRVVALLGTCVVIPCSFTPSDTQHIWARDQIDIRLSYRGGMTFLPLQGMAFTSESGQQVSREFRGRSALVGEISKGDCSVKIDRVNWNDRRVFDLALKKRRSLVWGRGKSVSLEVVGNPEPPVISGVSSATEGQQVTINCSTSFPCPSKPPVLRWHLDKGLQPVSSEEVQTVYPQAHRPMLLASLTFTVSHHVKPILRCEVSYPGSKKASAVKDLHITFSPKDVRVEVQTLMVLEGGSALLVCTCKADPPASGYRWSYSQHGHTMHPHHRARTIRVYNVTRDMMVRCSAYNMIGRGESPLTALNVQYKPTISTTSSCVVEEFDLRCHCSVDANPSATVTWSINGTVPTREYNISIMSEDEVIVSSLRGRMNKPLTVICFASNAHGNNSWLLLQGEVISETELNLLLWLVVPAVAISAVLLIVLILLYCCRKRGSKRSAQFPKIYQDHAPLYINCAEVTHVYTNGSYQLVYQNCTPIFVRNKQIRPMARRGGARRLGEKRRGKAVRQQEKRDTSELQSSSAAADADAETGIYLEVL